MSSPTEDTPADDALLEARLIRESAEAFADYFLEKIATNQDFEADFRKTMAADAGLEAINGKIRVMLHDETFLNEVADESFRIVHTLYTSDKNLFDKIRERIALRNQLKFTEKRD